MARIFSSVGKASELNDAWIDMTPDRILGVEEEYIFEIKTKGAQSGIAQYNFQI